MSKNFLLLLAVLAPSALAVLSAPYPPRGFRPSQPFPLPDRVQTQIPAKQYGPPKPEYGPPTKPDDTTEPTTPPNNFNNNNPSKLNFQNVQNQKLPSRVQQVNFVFPSNSQLKMNYPQQLPEFGQKIQFKPQSNQGGISPSQGLPNPVPHYVFDELKSQPQFNKPSSASFEIQKSMQLPIKGFLLPSNNNPNLNFNNQNNLNVQTPSLPGILGIPQKGSRVVFQNPQIERMNRIENTEILNRNQVLSNGQLAAKRASSSRRGGKATAAPIRQNLSAADEDKTPNQKRRRPVTESPDNDEQPITRRPNASIENAFAGRLFLLQPDGRLEPVILRRANPNPTEEDVVQPSELIKPFRT